MLIAAQKFLCDITVSRRCKICGAQSRGACLTRRRHSQVRQHENAHFHLPKTLRVSPRVGAKAGTKSLRKAHRVARQTKRDAAARMHRGLVQRRVEVKGERRFSSVRHSVVLTMGSASAEKRREEIERAKEKEGDGGGGGRYSYFGAFHN